MTRLFGGDHLAERIQLDMDNGAKRILLPAENNRDFGDIPTHLQDKVQIIYYSDPFTAAEVIEELIEMSKNIQEMDNEPEEMGLSYFEYAFYTAVANNDSAKELMQVEKLKELAVVLTELIRNNASIDWTIKESARAKLRVIVKKTLRKYGYPLDMEN